MTVQFKMVSGRKTIICIAVFCLALCLQLSLASLQFRVGGPRGWLVPTGTETETYNQWAERNRFQVNDSLYFKYKKNEDSVLLVAEEAYNTCNTSNPIASFDDGNTVIKFRRSGPFFFISGATGHCEKGQKLIVVVLSPRNAHGGYSPSPSPFQGGRGSGNSSSNVTSTAPTSITFDGLCFTTLVAVLVLLSHVTVS